MKKGIWVGLVILLVSSPAMAAPVCLERAQILRVLEESHGERVEYVGVVGTGEALMELLISESGSWSIMFTPPIGVSCIMAVGTGWQKKRNMKGSGI